MPSVFDWLFKRKAPSASPSPLAVYDAAVSALDRQTVELRKAAATLLALRSGLLRSVDGAKRRRDQLEVRRADALAAEDLKSQQILDADVSRAAAQEEADRQALARCEADAQLLLERAQQLSRELDELRRERDEARVKLAAGAAVTGPLAAHGDAIERALKLDAARDEVERAHALAEVVREDVKGT